MRRLIFPSMSRGMEESYEVDNERCEECNIKEYLKREYCSIGRCAKDLEDREENK